jgi:dienelactone hydrolase
VLNGLFFTPDLAAAGFPAVVVLHGCDGMYSRLAERRDRLTQRHQAMADLLLAEGYAVLFPDSFNPRGRREVCTLPARDQPITQDKRRLDVLGALDYLHSRQDIAANRIALVGWSHGGSAVLATMNARHPAVAAYIAGHADPAAFFLTAVAFILGAPAAVRRRWLRARAGASFHRRGGRLDVGQAPRCLGEAMNRWACHCTSRRIPTYHGFDTPNLSKPQHLDMPNGVHPGSGVTIAANAEARRRLRADEGTLRAVLWP